VAAGLALPHAAQAIQIVRRRKLPRKRKWSSETVYAITSLTVTQASPAELAAIIRGHWLIEDRLHWVRGARHVPAIIYRKIREYGHRRPAGA
jgi:predicted transposase YbfD/YdcC